MRCDDCSTEFTGRNCVQLVSNTIKYNWHSIMVFAEARKISSDGFDRVFRRRAKRSGFSGLDVAPPKTNFPTVGIPVVTPVGP